MSDIEKSGDALEEPIATTPAAQRGDENATEHASQEAQPPPQSDFAFGTSSGSGLARGKRKVNTIPSTTAPQSTPQGYQPTAIEVITPKSEYANPFTGETVVETPRRESTPQVEAPKAEGTLQPKVVNTGGGETSDDEAQSESAPTDLVRRDPVEGEESPKPELKILPPAETNRSRQSWESPSEHPARRAASADSDLSDESESVETSRSRSPRGSSAGRPTFQPEKRTTREPRESSEGRRRSEKPHSDRSKRTPREPRERTTERSPRTTAKSQPQPKGFFGWLKSLFGGADTKAVSRPDVSHGSRSSHDEGIKRRSRGGRGRSGSNSPRNGTGEPHGNTRRNGERLGTTERHSPNRNSADDRERPRQRTRGGRGGRGRGPHSEGQHSGGAI